MQASSRPHDHDPNLDDGGPSSGEHTDEGESGSKTVRGEIRALIVKSLIGVVVAVGGMTLISALVAEPVERFTRWVVGLLGLPGLAAGLILGEGTPLPIPGDAWLFAVAAGDSPMLAAGLTLGISSVVAGTIAYRLGPVLARLPVLRALVAAHRVRGEAFFAKFGGWTMVLAAVTPLPYVMLCWTAGICRMPYRSFFAATLLRVPRFMVYLLLFRLGWQSIGA